MADPLSIRAFYATLSATFTTKKNLNELLAASYAALSPGQIIASITAVEIRLLFPQDNGVAVLLGDSNLSTTNYGFSYAPGSSDKYGVTRMSALPMSNIFVMAADGTTPVKVGIIAIPA